MASPATPRTPSAQTPQLHTPNGTWKHPKFDEITRRQYATTFDERNVRAIVANAGLLFISICANTVASKVKLVGYAVAPVNALITRTPYSDWGVLLVRFIFVVNMVIAFLPLVRRYYPDDIADIPLTPSQRTSMGLRADVVSPPTPGSTYASPAYVTPPRYQRSTPRSSFSSHGERPTRMLSSGSPRPSLGRSTSNSSFSNSNNGGSATNRLSHGGGSPFSSSLFGDSSSSGPGTPTPSTGKASVGLNNKWLYEKRRDSPRSGMFN